MTRQDNLPRGRPVGSSTPNRRPPSPRVPEVPLERVNEQATTRRRPQVVPGLNRNQSAESSKLRRMLSAPGALRRIMLLREVLGPPKGLE